MRVTRCVRDRIWTFYYNAWRRNDEYNFYDAMSDAKNALMKPCKNGSFALNYMPVWAFNGLAVLLCGRWYLAYAPYISNKRIIEAEHTVNITDKAHHTYCSCINKTNPNFRIVNICGRNGFYVVQQYGKVLYNFINSGGNLIYRIWFKSIVNFGKTIEAVLTNNKHVDILPNWHIQYKLNLKEDSLLRIITETLNRVIRESILKENFKKKNPCH